MSKIKCPQCGDRDVSITLYTPPDKDVASCRKCGYTSLAEDFPEQSLFDRITETPEVLAEKFVYREFPGQWRSTIVPLEKGGLYYNKPEAISATVAKLKEIAE